MIECYIEEVVLASFPVLDYDQDAADWHALERARLEAVGKIPPFIDGQIAAIAYVNELIRVASNPTNFRAFKGVQIRNWS